MSFQEINTAILNFADFAALLGEQAYSGDGQPLTFELFLYGTKGRNHKPDFNNLVDRFSGFNPHNDPHLGNWILEQADEREGFCAVKEGEHYVVAACEPGSLTPLAYTRVQVPANGSGSAGSNGKSQGNPAAPDMRGQIEEVMGAMGSALTSYMKEAITGVLPRPKGAAMYEEEEEEGEDNGEMIKLQNGLYMSRDKALEMMANQMMFGGGQGTVGGQSQAPTPEPEPAKDDLLGQITGMLPIIEKLGPAMAPMLAKLFSGGGRRPMMQQPQPPYMHPQAPPGMHPYQQPTVGAPPPGMAPPGMHPQQPYPQPPYPQQAYPQQPYPQPEQMPQQPPEGQQPAPSMEGLGDLLGGGLDPSAIQGIAEQLGMPGLDSILNNLMNLNSPGGGQNPAQPQQQLPPQPSGPAKPAGGMTSIPNIPGMSFGSDDEYEDDDEYEYEDDDDYEDGEYEEEEDDMLGSEGRQLASALYMVIYPIYSKKDKYDSIEAMEEAIKVQSIDVFKTKGIELFTPDILEDWCVEAAEALEAKRESESANNLYGALSKVNKLKIRTFGGKIAEQVVKNTIAEVLASLRGTFYPMD